LARWDVSWQLKNALETAGIQLSSDQYHDLEEQCKNAIYQRAGSQTPSQHTSFVGNIMASRIAALWDFSGPAFTISCGENSVFKALEVAQNLLSMGEVDAVVVGGVDFSGGLENVLLRNKEEGVNTSQKPSLSWNHQDKGWLIGEGAGAVVLKRSDQIQSESVYAIIDDIAAQGTATDIGYLELAATGFAAQDRAEWQNLPPSTQQAVALGSVKSNIGHTFAASGIAALIKTALCLHHRFIPGIPNWQAPKSELSFQAGAYYFPTTSRPWILNQNEQRKAAVNGVGDWQIQMREGLSRPKKPQGFLVQNTARLFCLRGADEKALLQQLSALEIALETDTALPTLAQQFYHNFQSKTGKYCIVLVAQSIKRLKIDLHFFQKQLGKAWSEKRTLKTPQGSYFTSQPLGRTAKIAFVYPGSATAYENLGQSIFQLFPDLYAHYEQLSPSMDEFIFSHYLYPKTLRQDDPKPSIHHDAIAMMSTGVFFSATYTHLLRHYFKVEPDMAFGYSMGECSSMWYALGIWASGEAKEFQQSPIFKHRFSGDLDLLADHWRISSEEAQQRWQSLIVLAPLAKVETLVDKEALVYLTFINTDNEVIISGDKVACQRIVEQLQCNVVEVPFQNIIHHDFCQAEEKGLLKMHDFPIQEKPNIQFFSSIEKGPLPLDRKKIAANSTAVCYQEVNFPENVQNVYHAGARVFIELGANATCTTWIHSILKEKAHLAVSMNQKGKSDEQVIVELLAQLLSHGLEVNLNSLFNDQHDEGSGRKFMKKIIPGGNRVYDTLLSETNRSTFAEVAIARHAKTMVLATATLGTDLKQHSSIQNKISMLEVNKTETLDPTVAQATTTEVIGENGLIIYNFKDGRHLEGKNIVFSQEDLIEFANGKIGKVFGPEYNIIDTYRRRVMLPMDPYLLVSRVTGLEGKKDAYVPSSMQTEYDIPHNAWFTTDRQIPWAVSVESGQCDLLLISYLGIDFQNKGDLVYRLLDCTLTFVDDLPFEGQTLRYDISINSFVKNGDNLLFFFSYRCYVQERLVLKMDGGCAGFFTDEQLDEGNGVVYSDGEIEARANAVKKHFTPLLHTKKTSFSKEDLRHLINGDIEKCFGDESYYANGRNPSLCLPPEKILMLDRIVSVDLRGGAYGLGLIIAEKDLHPDDWFFPCHFRDDEVLAGSLQAEGGGNLLRFFMLMLGLQRLTKDARYQPVFDLPQKVRCRKQVTPKDTKLVYRLEIKKIGLVPNPYVIGDLEIISNDVVTVHFENLGLQLREKSNPRYLEQEKGTEVNPRSEGALMNEKDITTFALDNLSECFGPEFAVYDGRTVSRQPNTDLQLISRILKIDGQRHQFKQPSTIYAEYDVPQNAWYYEQNSSLTMPYSVLMEIALQPCGLLGAWLGSTLQFPEQNLYFRNLDGTGEMLELPAGTDFRGKTISNKAVLASSVALGGTILQNYTFECSVDGQVFYRGKSSFGFFPGEALASQVGLDNGQSVAPWYRQQGLSSGNYMQIKLDSLYGKMKLFKAPAEKPHYRLAGHQLTFLDQLIIAKNQGEHGLGYVYAQRKVRTYDWFFTCHFYQDPVMPGSLGVEAILEAMQVFAIQQDLAKDMKNPRFVQLANHTTNWKYRGQILLHSEQMQLEVHFKSIETINGQIQLLADAYLWNGEMRIYQVSDLGLGIVDQA
ncbi:MAG: PfaB family protein, partial [Bacteroidota bacterium]